MVKELPSRAITARDYWVLRPDELSARPNGRASSHPPPLGRDRLYLKPALLSRPTDI